MKNTRVLLKFLRLILTLFLAAFIPLAGMGLFYTFQPNTYIETYYAELPRKVDRLEKIPGRRIVVIGGSSAAFGIDSKLMERELGLPCINFGLYAAFGLKPMLDLSISRLNRGDIVVIMPETTSQMYSDYCGYDYLLQAFETEPLRLVGLGTGYFPGLLSKIPKYALNAAELRKTGGAAVSGVYALSSFDEYGDIVYPRPENVMGQGYTQDNLPEIRPDIVTRGFLDMVNDYTRSARRKGADVYFSFCPINKSALTGTDEAVRESFVDSLRKGLDCPLLSPLSDHIMDAGYFYDSNYHMNETGMRYNTLLLVSDLQRILGEMRQTNEALPHPPVLQQSDTILSSGIENGIQYDIRDSGATVTGLDDQCLTMNRLSIPDTLGGVPVISIASGAFSGSSAEEISLPTTILRLPGRLFAGCDRLKSVILLSSDIPEVGDDLLSEADPDLRIYVPSQLYGTYITNYFWGAYSENLEASE